MWSSKSWLSMVAGETNVSWLLDLLGQTPAMEGRTVGTREIEGEENILRSFVFVLQQLESEGCSMINQIFKREYQEARNRAQSTRSFY